MNRVLAFSMSMLITASAVAEGSKTKTVDCTSGLKSSMQIVLDGNTKLENGSVKIVRSKARKGESKVISFRGLIIVDWENEKNVFLSQTFGNIDPREAYQYSSYFIELPKSLVTSNRLNNKTFKAFLMIDDTDNGRELIDIFSCEVRK